MDKLKHTILLLFLLIACNDTKPHTDQPEFNRNKIVERADDHLTEAPTTITSYEAIRSKGGKHDYYSEGRYWWPDTSNIDGPYIRRDGLSNPDLFTQHRDAVKNFEAVVCDLTVAAVLTKQKKYAEHALRHMNAWFVEDSTKMNPSLLYGQAIKGIVDGRGIGMIDIIGFINVTNAIRLLEKEELLKGDDLKNIRGWFGSLADWSTTHQYGIDEKNNNNNHSTWWGAQIAAYGLVSKNSDIVGLAISQYKDQLLIQMEKDGTFPDEIGRTKPSHYTNYNLFAWTTFAELLSETDFDAWHYATNKGSIKEAVDFAYQYFESPEKWPYLTDLEKKFNPEHSEFLYLSSLGLDEEKYYNAWVNTIPSGGSDESSLWIWKMLEQ